MSLPEHLPSTVPVPGAYLYPDSLGVGLLIDYEMGGDALNDGSAGLQLQAWACWAEPSGDVVIKPLASAADPVLLFNAAGITELSFAFDRNMRVSVAYTVGGIVKLRWYDSAVPGYVTTDFPGIRNPRLSHDDKRDSFSSQSDVIFAYLSGTELRWREQRDRYDTEYVWAAGILPSLRLKSIGMNGALRMQAEFERIAS